MKSFHGVLRTVITGVHEVEPIISCLLHYPQLVFKLLDCQAVPLELGVLLLKLFLQLPLAGLCVAHLVTLQLVLGDSPPPLCVLCLDLQHHACDCEAFALL